MWDIDINYLKNKCDDVIKKSKKIREYLLNLNLNDIENRKKFIEILSDDIVEFTTFQDTCAFFQVISDDKKVKDCCYKISNKLYNFIIDMDTKENFYDKIMQYHLSENITDRKKNRFIKRLLNYYKRNGIKLEDNDKEKYIEYENKIKNIKYELTEEIRNYSNNIELHNDELDGIDYNLISKFRNNDKFNIPLTKQYYNLCISNITNPNVRKKVYIKYNSKCINSIYKLMELTILRYDKAKLLGYNSYIDYKVETQMAKKSSVVKKFLSNISGSIDNVYSSEMEILLKFKKKEYSDKGISFDNIINAWDIDYYFNKWKNEYGLDDNDIMKYFPYDHVINQIFKIYENIFKIRIKVVNNTKVWNKDVKLYSVYDTIDSKKVLLGNFYLDAFARDNKPNFTRCFSLKQACTYPLKSNKKQQAIVALITNFVKYNNVCLLKHNDIILLMREICHIIHSICGSTKFSIFSGVNVEKDYVKIPSLAMEKLCWDKNILKNLSRHYKNGNVLSDNTIDKMIKVRNLDIGHVYKNHLMLSLYDHLVHSDNFPQVCKSVLKTDVSKENMKDIMVTSFMKLYDRNFSFYSDNIKRSIGIDKKIFNPLSWTNIISEFDGEIYNFLWSDVHATDIYYEKLKNYNNDDNIGIEFRRILLEPGGSRDAIAMITEYLERKPSIDNFLYYNKFQNNKEEYSFFFKSDYFKNKRLSSNQSTEIYNSSDISDDEFSPIKTSESSSSNESSKTVSNKKTEMNKYTEIGDSEFSYLTSHNYDKGLGDTEIENSMTISQINNTDIFVKRKK